VGDHPLTAHEGISDVSDDPIMPLRQALEIALSHAAQTEQRVAELHHKRHALEREGMHDRAATVDVEIAHLQRSLVQIELYVRTVRQNLPPEDGGVF
jgi:hypothetical protein